MPSALITRAEEAPNTKAHKKRRELNCIVKNGRWKFGESQVSFLELLLGLKKVGAFIVTGYGQIYITRLDAKKHADILDSVWSKRYRWEKSCFQSSKAHISGFSLLYHDGVSGVDSQNIVPRVFVPIIAVKQVLNAEHNQF